MSELSIQYRRKSSESILVALSGGVDSSTAAAILKEKDYDVEGAIMAFEGVSDEDINYAYEATKKLGVPFHCVDFTLEYKEKIINNFIQEYQKGRTPNPCVLCNKHIKFDLFLQKARQMGMEKIATGHYARIKKQDGRYLLKKGVDKNEQSYFLYRLDQQQLSKISLPLGSYKKEEVRKMAKKFNLPTAQRKKSQDVCFIPDGDYVAYLEKLMPKNPGPILDKAGNIIGEHKGIIFYTCGQRHGIGISHRYPYYVTKIDAEKNAIYVGERKDVYKSKLIASDLSFISFDKLETRLEVMAKVRYFSPLSAATIEPVDIGRVRVVFKKPQWAITPGQSVVFYQEELAIGGGIIDEALD